MPSEPAAPAPDAATPHDLDAARIARVLADEYGIAVASLEPIAGGWDGEAVVWAATDDDGRRWSVKVTVRDVAFGLHVASSLALDGAEGIVPPLRTRDGRVGAEVAGVGIVVSAWVEGIDAVDVAIDDVDWERLGRTLRSVHDHLPPQRASVPRRGIRRFARAPRALLADLDARLAAADDDASTAAVRARWAEARDRLDHLARAERALKRSRTPTSRVTLHGDPHLGNVVVDRHGRPWLIDFDEAAVAPREVDLMLVELGVLFSKPIGEQHRRRFRDGYGRDAVVDEQRIARFGCVRAIEDVVLTMQRALDAGGDEHLATIDGILGPDGLVTLVEHELRRLGLEPPTGG